MSAGATVHVPQKDVFGASMGPSRKELEGKLNNLRQQVSANNDYFRTTGDPRDYGQSGVDEWNRTARENEQLKAEIAKLEGELSAMK